jgi:hypothetical protein
LAMCRGQTSLRPEQTYLYLLCYAWKRYRQPVDERIGLLSSVDQWLQEYSHKFLPIEVRVVYYLFA